jgi:catechol 2,3-dioxygenase-like lactoylglutathione lyase family enzyme
MARLFVNIDVDDIEKGTRFYTDALGLRVGRRLGEDFVELLGAETPLYLLLTKAGSAPAPDAIAPRDFRRHWTPVHLDFVVDDLEAAVRRAEAAGAMCEKPISSHAWGRMANFSDPFGHGFCLLQMSARGYDEIAIR